MTGSRFFSALIYRHRERLIFAALLLAAILLFWWRIWTPDTADRMHFTDDILIKDYPTRMGLFRELSQGHLPLWDAYQFGGWPGIANCEAGFFYPPNWLILPWVNAPQSAFFITELTVLFHLFIAGLGGYAYARAIGLSPLAASFTGIAFTFCGFHCAHKKHTNMLYALVWFPWMMLIAEHWLRKANPKWLLSLSLLFTLAILAGHPQACLYMGLILLARLLYGCVLQASRSERTSPGWLLKTLAILISPFLLSIALTAIQWSPTLELIGQSERAEAGQYTRSSEFSLPPYELTDAVLPETLSQWGQTEVFYWGITPLLLSLLLIIRGGFNAVQRFQIAVAVLSILLAMGSYLFLYDVSYLLIPGIAWVRAPSRWIYFASLPIALLAGMTLDWFRAQGDSLWQSPVWPFYRRILLIIGAVMLLIILLVVLILAAQGWQQAISGNPNPAAIEASRAALQEVFIDTVFAVIFAASFFFLLGITRHKRIGYATLAVGLIALTWLDLGTHYRNLDLAPGVGGYEMDETVESLQEAIWNHRTKVFLGGGGIRDRYHGPAQDFYELDGNSPLTPQINLDLREDTALNNPNNPNLALFDLLGIRAVIADFDFMPTLFTQTAPQLFINPTPALRARLAPETFAASLARQRALISLQSFPYNRVALVPPETQPENEAPAATPTDALFPKPFLLASASINAVQQGAYLIIDGKDYFSDLGDEPGYYFAVAHPETGAIEDTAMFNLMASVSSPGYPQHERMTQFIADIPPDRIVFAAIADNAANVLLPRGLAALRAIGASADVRSGYRIAHAVIGRKGAPVGSAVELVSATEALVLQTQQSIYAQGVQAAAPQNEWHRNVDHPRAWVDLYQNIHDPRLPQERFHNPAAPEQAPPIITPMAVYSSRQAGGTSSTFLSGAANIIIGGTEVSPNQKGYNLVQYDPAAGEVIRADAFDLVEDFAPDSPETGYLKDPPAQNRRMQAFIRNAQDGHYILGAVRDEAIDMLIPQTIAVMQEALGSQIEYQDDPAIRKSLAHAFIAVKGQERCIESIQQGQDAFILSRYPGGPALMAADLPNPESQPSQWSYPADPVQTIMDEDRRPHWAADQMDPIPWGTEQDGPNRITLSGHTESGGVVLLGDVFFPGWQATLDGAPVPVQRINYYFRGVEVPQGEHQIEMVYSPMAFWIGFWITLLTLLALLGLGIERLARRMRSS